MDRFSDRGARPTLQTSERPTSYESPAPQSGATPTRRAEARRTKVPFGTKGIAALVVLLALALGAFWWFFWRNMGVPSYVETDKYQAVFLVNGEFYFGKVQSVTDDNIKLTDVYYVQKATNTDPKNTANKLELIKLGNEVHGPQDMMAINRSQVLYVENLKNDGQVAKLIAEDKNKK